MKLPYNQLLTTGAARGADRRTLESHPQVRGGVYAMRISSCLRSVGGLQRRAWHYDCGIVALGVVPGAATSAGASTAKL